MRIIGGRLKGRSILPPVGFKARPTTDFAKEGLFNILDNRYDLSAMRILDLFAGTGSISYEFASRDAGEIYAVEMNPLHAGFIRKSVSRLNLKNVHVVRHNVFDFLNICTLDFDIIFADPPYSIDRIETIPDKILSANSGRILKPEGILIMEHPGSCNFSSHPLFIKEKKYGNVHFSFFAPFSEQPEL